MQVTRVRLHPVKSFAGFDVRQARVLPWGLEGDRRWGVVDHEGVPVTAREESALLGLRAELAEGGLRSSGREPNSIWVSSLVRSSPGMAGRAK